MEIDPKTKKEMTIKALKEYIEDWKQSILVEWRPTEVKIKRTPQEPEHSKLCDIHLKYEERKAICDGCPINKNKKHNLCHGTPYNNAYNAFLEWYHAWNRGQEVDIIEEHRNEFRELAKKQVKFLERRLANINSRNY